jgi:hypothetical protein
VQVYCLECQLAGQEDLLQMLCWHQQAVQAVQQDLQYRQYKVQGSTAHPLLLLLLLLLLLELVTQHGVLEASHSAAAAVNSTVRQV